MYKCHGTHVEVREQPSRTHSSLPPCRPWGLNSGCQAGGSALTDCAHLIIHLSKQFWKSGKHVAVKQSNISWYPCIIKFVPHTNKNRLFGSGWGSHTCSTSIWESKTRRPTVQGQPRLFSKTPISKIRNRIIEKGKTAFGQQQVMKTSSAGPQETLVLVWGLSKGTVLPEAR